jgi:hypothetical protein
MDHPYLSTTQTTCGCAGIENRLWQKKNNQIEDRPEMHANAIIFYLEKQDAPV